MLQVEIPFSAASNSIHLSILLRIKQHKIYTQLKHKTVHKQLEKDKMSYMFSCQNTGSSDVLFNNVRLVETANGR